MKNSDEFLESFNAIEKACKKLLKQDTHSSFGSLIGQLKFNNPLIRRYSDDLLLFANLRNAIVHESRANYVIAEPHDEVVRLINKVKDDLINPEKVIPKFQRPVSIYTKTDSLASVLNDIRTHNYSQFPITDDGQIIEVLNTNTIARWLASREIVESNSPISEILPHIEFKTNFKVIPRNTTIYQAIDLFSAHYKQNRNNLDALLITNSGSLHESLIGIITTEDLSVIIS